MIRPAAELDQAIGGQLAAGDGVLAVARTAAGSSLLRSRATNPLKLLVPKPVGPAVWAYTTTYGGGLLAGDAIDLNVSLAADSTVVLASQATTKVFKRLSAQPHVPDLGAARQVMRARVEAGAVFISIPDPISCFADASYVQEQYFDLAEGASVLAIDWLTAGRIAHGEWWSFDTYRSRTDLRLAGRLLCSERLRLQNEAVHGSVSERMADYAIVGTMYVLGPQMIDVVQRLQGIGQAALQGGQAIDFAVSPVADGLLVRLAARDIEAAQRWLYGILDPLVDLCGGRPWRRRP